MVTVGLSILDLVSQYAPRAWKEHPRSKKNRYSMACPLPGHSSDREHRDHSGSFSVDETGELYRCFGCNGKGNAQQLLKILSGQDSIPAHPLPRSAPKPKQPRRREPPEFQGATIDSLIAAKGLPPECAAFARNALGWRDTSYYGAPAICMPYLDQDNNDAQLRFRVGVTGDRFRWQSGAQLRLYGLEQLDLIRARGYVVIVEGESDVLALRFNGHPALGVPGASNFRPEWAKDLQGLTVYVWREPGPAGEALIEKIRESLPNALVINSPEGAKDPCELASQCGGFEAFSDFLNDLLNEAEPPPTESVVPNKVNSSSLDIHHIRDKQRDSGQRPALWAEAKELFPIPAGVKPRTRVAALFSERDGKALVANLFSATWKNVANAQFKRQKIYFNLMPRVYGPRVYQREVAFDDWSPQVHQAISKAINRAKKEDDGWIWFDNATARGYFLYLTSVEGLSGFTLVEDVKPVLIDALNAIRPPGPEEPGRFRPIGGSDNWASKTDSTGEENQHRWRIVGTLNKQADFVEIEAEAVASAVDCEYDKAYWRTQVGQGLRLSINTLEEAVKFFSGLGFTLTRAARPFMAGVLE